MMNDYPEARRYYMDRAWDRRIEFRRRQKKFLVNLRIKLDRHFQKEFDSDISSSQDEYHDKKVFDEVSSQSNSSNDEEFIDSEEEKKY